MIRQSALPVPATALCRGVVLGLVLACWALLLALPVQAVEPDEMLPDPVAEARAQAIGREVRCLVCRNESIEDSNADLARDLRLVVRERIAAGDDDAEVMAFLSDRFGDFVRLRPRFGGTTMMLWLAGPLCLLFGAGVIWGTLRQRRPDAATLSQDEEAALRALLRDGDGDDRPGT